MRWDAPRASGTFEDWIIITYHMFYDEYYFGGLMQYCSTSNALAMEIILQPCIKPSI